MFKFMSEINRFLATLLGLGVLAVVSVAGWVGGQAYLAPKWELEKAQADLAHRASEVAALQKGNQQLQKDNQDLKNDNQALEKDVQAKQQHIERLDTALRLMVIDQRVARIDVVGQTGSAQTNDLTTRFTFVELGAGDKPIETPREFSIQGDIVYIDAEVVKYQDKLIEAGDPERSASICLFRRLFGESQQPKNGYLLDVAGTAPTAYRGGHAVTPFEQEVWSRFWDYANDPKLAEQAGVRAAHGEAPFIKLVPGKTYKILLRSSGGLSIVPEETPVKKPGAT
jgi:cell division protein FtsB